MIGLSKYFFSDPVIKLPSPQISHINYSTISIEINEVKQIWKWRGTVKYLYIMATAVNESTYTFSESIFNKSLVTRSLDLNPTKNVKPVDRHHYWILDFQLYFESKYSLEDVANMSTVCNDTKLDAYWGQTTDLHFTLHDMHPYTDYKIMIKPCNEIGCGDKIVSVENKTSTYKPAVAPPNVTIEMMNKSTSLLAKWNEMGKFYRHGIIRGYHIILAILRLNETRFENKTDEIHQSMINYTLSNIGKYEQACIQVAAFTLFPEYGPYSSVKCGRTDEFGSVSAFFFFSLRNIKHQSISIPVINTNIR